LSRLTDLIAQTRAKNPELGAELEREFKVVSSRRSFGLNFERHRPESVELPVHPLRKPQDFTQAIVDTTVAEKNIAFPTDAKLIHRARERLVRQAQEAGINLRQSYKRVPDPVLSLILP
jgi:hypothetical protein